MTDANVIAGYNYQQRRFADFAAFESQNWFMVGGSRAAGAGRLTLDRDVVARAADHRAAGVCRRRRHEPRVRGLAHRPASAVRRIAAALSDRRELSAGAARQRPAPARPDHGARRDLPRRADRAQPTSFGADLVGSPTLGPTAVHASRIGARQPAGAAHPSRSRLDPHHAGRAARRRRDRADDVRGVGVSGRGAGPGRQPLQHRAAGARFLGGAGQLASRPVAGAVFRRAPARSGMVRAVRDDADHRLGRIRRRRRRRARSPRRSRGASIARTTASTITPTATCSNGTCAPRRGRRSTDAWKLSAKQIFGLGLHPAGFNHPHVYSHVDALTLRPASATSHPRPWGRLGIGADVTVYRMSPDLVDYFGVRGSFHVFVRWRPAQSMAHVH